MEEYKTTNNDRHDAWIRIKHTQKFYVWISDGYGAVISLMPRKTEGAMSLCLGYDGLKNLKCFLEIIQVDMAGGLKYFVFFDEKEGCMKVDEQYTLGSILVTKSTANVLLFALKEYIPRIQLSDPAQIYLSC